MNLEQIEAALGNDTALLAHQCKTIAKGDLHLPGPDFVDRIFALSDRSPRVMRTWLPSAWQAVIAGASAPAIERPSRLSA